MQVATPTNTNLPDEQSKQPETPPESVRAVELLKPGTPEVRFGTGKKQGKDGCGY
jgi:hypothetical protein